MNPRHSDVIKYRAATRLIVMALPCVLFGALSGCKARPRAAESSAGPVVAQIDGVPITAASLAADVSNRSSYLKLQLRSAPDREKLIGHLLEFETMAKEALDRGLDRDPDVLLTTKQAMINKLIASEAALHRPAAPSDASIEQYYSSHVSDFVRPERVRVSQIILRDASRAGSVLTAARALRPGDDQGFRALVRQYSDDEENKARGGDLGYISRENRDIPKAVLDGAFGLKVVGEVSGLIQVGNTRYLLRLLDRQPAATEPLMAVRQQIVGRLSGDARAQAIASWSATVRAKHAVRTFPENFGAVELRPSGHVSPSSETQAM